MEWPPITGVVHPDGASVAYDPAQGVPLGTGWFVLIVAFLIILGIILKKRFYEKKRVRRIEINENVEDCLESIRPFMSRAVKKGYSKEKIRRRIKKALA
jgi:hypothetical protein